MTRNRPSSMPLAGLPRLYLEELKGLARGRFALAGAAVVGLALALLAAILSGEGDGTTAFFAVTYGLMPVAFGPFAASSVAGPRANRYVEAVFTAPVTRGRWLTAKLLALLTVGAACLALTLPFWGVAVLTIGVPADAPEFLALGACGILFAVVLGLLLGVSFPGRGAAAPAGLAGGALLLSFLAMPVLVGAVEAAAPRESLIRVLHLSPHVLAAEAVGYVGMAAHPERSALAFGLLVAGLLGLAYRSFLREQGIDAWESPPPRRLAIALAATLLMVSPMAIASSEYEARTEREDHDLPFPGGEARTLAAYLAAPGTSAASVDFTDFWAGSDHGRRPQEVHEENARDLLLALILPPGTVLVDVEVHVEGTRGLAVVEGAAWSAERAQVEPATFPRGKDAIALRVPVVLLPDNATGYSYNFYGLRVHVKYRVEGDATLHEAEAHVPVRADVPGVEARLALAGLPGFVLPATAAVLRRVRTR